MPYSQAGWHPLKHSHHYLLLIMYSVLRRGASTSFSVLVALVAGCGGSTLGVQGPLDVPISTHPLSDAAACTTVEEIAATPHVYRCDSSAGPVFVATLRDCSVSEKFSFQATTRQLFVGVTGLTVLSQEPVSFGQLKALQTLVAGTMDAQPLSVSTFTYRDEGCVHDVVVWRTEQAPLAGAESSQAFAALSRSLAEYVLGALMEPGHGQS